MADVRQQDEPEQPDTEGSEWNDNGPPETQWNDNGAPEDQPDQQDAAQEPPAATEKPQETPEDVPPNAEPEGAQQPDEPARQPYRQGDSA